MSYYNAKIASKNLVVAGISGWRLPTKDELIRMHTVYRGQEIHPFTNINKGWYMSSSRTKDRKNNYVVSLGISFAALKSGRAYGDYMSDGIGIIWPVRGSE